MRVLILTNARLIDAADKLTEVRVEGERIAEVGARVTRRPDDRVEDLQGAVLAPAFFDPHVHFHVIPRYAAPRTFEGAVYADASWPKPPDLSSALTIGEPARERLLALLTDEFRTS